MHRNMIRTPLALATLLPLFTSGCSDSVDAAAKNAEESTEQSATTPEAKPEKTAERLLARSAERLEKMVRARDDSTLWIEIYDYETPEMKESVSLTTFLTGKDKYYYDQPTAPSLLLIEDDTAWVESSCLWLAGMHPAIGDAGDPNLVKPMEMIEVWKWVESDWYFEGPPRRRVDFFDDNPDFLARVKDAREKAQSEQPR